MLVKKVVPTKEDLDKILTLEQAKSFCRVVGNHDDGIIKDMISAAIEDAQTSTNLQFATATFSFYLDGLKSEIRLPKNPVQEIIEVAYFDSSGAYQVLDPSTYYFYEDLERGTIVFEKIPGIKRHKKAVKITFKCGYLKEEDFPKLLKIWLQNRVSTFYEHREEFIAGTIVSKVSHVDSVLSKYRIRTV